MTETNKPHDEPPCSHDDIALAAITCQARYHCWAQSTEPALREALRQAHHAAAEQLLALLWDDLSRIARAWARSEIASEQSSLVLNLFGSILLELPRLHIDPRRNPRNLLLQVARYGVYDQYHAETEHGPRRATSGDSTNGNETQYARVFLGPDALDEYADADSYVAEDRLLQMLDDAHCLRTIFAFWQRELNASDRLIVELRLQERQFREIATLLGANVSAVRQRYHRAIVRTREYLSRCGCFAAVSPATLA